MLKKIKKFGWKWDFYYLKYKIDDDLWWWSAGDRLA